jgi:hypothetical protein
MKDALALLTFWVRDLWKAALVVIAAAGLFIWLGIWATRNSALKPIADEGEIVQFAAYSFETGPKPVVVVRLRDGRVVQLRASASATTRCRVGSRIRLVWHGEIVTVDPRGCPPPAP